MDKYEYKLRSDEIKELIKEQAFEEAAEIADAIDWKRVKSVMMLCTISDLYKINKRYEDSKNILLMAYERHPGGRSIVYSLCELSIKLEEYVQAIEYYKEFVKIAPKDSGRYILQYKLYEAQDVSLEERIEVLAELKKRDYKEKWAYELAFLYHQVGMSEQCVAECDELFTWFGHGKYVMKALELKMLHAQLSPEQQQAYNGSTPSQAYTMEPQADNMDSQATKVLPQLDGFSEQYMDSSMENSEEPADEMDDIQVKPMDVSPYNTINLQKELAESMKEVLAPDADANEIFFEDHTGQMEPVPEPILEPVPEPILEPVSEPVSEPTSEAATEMIHEETATETVSADTDMTEIQPTTDPDEMLSAANAAAAIEQMRKRALENMNRPSGFDNMLSQEYDGQISLVVPESEQIEKQITGQISLQDVILEWERMKHETKERNQEEIRQRVKQETGDLFAQFDEEAKRGIMAELEAAADEAEAAELAKKEAFKKSAPEPEDLEVEEAEEFEELEEEPESVPEDMEIAEEVEPDEEDLTEDQEEFEEVEEIEEIAENDETETEISDESDDEEDDIEEASAEQPASGDTPTRAVKVRKLTPEEKELFGGFIQGRKSREQFVQAIDAITMASYIGNVIVTGEQGMDTMSLAKKLIKNVQYTDHNFSGKTAKIAAASFNKKDIVETIERMEGGALIITGASDLTKESADTLYKALNKEEKAVIVVLEDQKKAMNKFLEHNPKITECFNSRIDLEALDDESLVTFGRMYAKEMEYSIDDMGVLELHTRIADMQTSDHSVTVAEVKDIIDDAIYHANRKTPKHFLDILLRKRYDENDMIILSEKDFA
ncbi:MAG: hypothetical protein PHP50_06900 [Lachnospiraceae bacterium]|nr:hypothetical protein [Lachnospiraceae bacterium]